MMQTFTASYKCLESSNIKLKVGDYCAAKFTVDNQWYRAQILQVSPTKATVRYIDYGNVESVNISSILALLDMHSIENLSPQAVKVELAHIDFLHDDEEYFSKAQSLFANREFVVKVVDKSSVLLYPIGSPISINEELLKSGFFYVKSCSISMAKEAHQRKIKSGLGLQMLSDKDDLEKLVEAQDEAKRHHLNIWRYGDFQDDE